MANPKSDSGNVECVLALYAAGAAGDWATARTLVTSDFAIREPECFPFGGIYEGIEALQAFYASIFEAAGPTEIAMNAITSGDDHVVVLVTLHMHTHGVSANVAETFRLVDGKIAEINVYYQDPPRVAEIYSGVADAIAANFPNVNRRPSNNP